MKKRVTNNKMKKVSVILTTFNCQENIEKTLKSIEEQDYPDVEIVVKDGGSTDGTLDIIKEYKNQSTIPVIVTSCSDKGIYDAMNQGYALTTGEILVFFNDRFIEASVISKMVEAMDRLNPKTGKPYVGAHADLVYADGDRVIRSWHMGEGNIKQGWMPGHPTLFLRREIYEKYGLYNTSFRIAADYEFMIRFLKDEENQLVYLPETIVSMYYGGTSSSGLSSYLLSLKEGHRALKINGIKGAWVVDVLRTMRVLLQFVKAKC